MKFHLPSTGPIPVAERAGRGFVPVLFHPSHGTERYPRNAKATPDEAITYAARVLWWRQRRAAEKRRHGEAISHPRFATWGELAAAPEQDQQAYWKDLVASWRRNAEAERDADVRFDYSADRKTMWGACE
jgi:hypothetical protein